LIKVVGRVERGYGDADLGLGRLCGEDLSFSEELQGLLFFLGAFKAERERGKSRRYFIAELFELFGKPSGVLQHLGPFAFHIRKEIEDRVEGPEESRRDRA